MSLRSCYRLPTFARILAVLLFLASAPVARGVNRVWLKAGGTGDWTNPSNWSPFGAPQSGDDIFATAVNPNTNVIFFDESGPVFKLYHSILIDESGAGTMTLQQPGNSLNASSLTIGLGGSGTYDMQAGFGGFGTVALNNSSNLLIGAPATFQSTTFTQNNGTLLVNGTFSAGSFVLHAGTVLVNGTFGGGNFTQAGGRVIANTTMTFSGTYAANAGTFDPGTFGGGAVNAGTFIDNMGTFAGSVDAGHLVVNGNGTFLENVTNRSALVVPAGQTIFSAQEFDQIGGTVTQSGFVGGKAPGGIGSTFATINIGGGAAWGQNAGTLQGTTLVVGSGNGGPGTYGLSGTGFVNIGGIGVGVLSDGAVVQSGGTVQAPSGVALGGIPGFIRGNPPPPGQRGYYTITSGTLLTGGIIVGAQDSLLGQFSQSGGWVDTDQLICNVNSTSTGTVNISGGNFTARDVSVNNGSYAQTGGVVQFSDHLDGAGTVNVNGTGTLVVARLRQNSLSIGGNGHVSIVQLSFGTIGMAESIVSRVHMLSFEQAGSSIKGTLDLGGTRLAVDYDGASPIANVRRYLASGYAGGNWNGTGIASGAASLNSGHHTGLGYAESADVFGAAGGNFGGLFVDNSAVLVRYTFYGDSNLDGTVDTLDFNALAGNFGKANQSWTHADFNYDGVVDTLDFNSLAGNFGKSLPESSPRALRSDALVPEPLTLSLLILPFLFPRRRRAQRRPA